MAPGNEGPEAIAELLRKRTFELDEQQVEILQREGFVVQKVDRGQYSVEDALISPRWRIGGRDGCEIWGKDSKKSKIKPDDKPIWLEELLERIYPEIPYLKFRRLERACRQYMLTRDDFYGDYEEYAFEVLKLSDLHAVLVSR